MAEPRQKSLELPAHLTRILPLWQTPQWLAAERWRQVVYNLPVAIDCRGVLIDDLQASDWEVMARDPKEEDALALDIEHYTNILNVDMGFAMTGFDYWIDVMGQDMLTIPAGGNSEVVRWSDGMGPLSRPHPKGHVFKIVYVDGASIFPTFDKLFPIGQRIQQDFINHVFFQSNEIARMVISPRPELLRWGYGMAPPEKIFLAITLLFRGDQYYANLLLDTPEAGVLDLMDMSKDSARDWVSSFKSLVEGIDPMKIGVGYEHEKAWNWISFGRPPTEMMFDTTYLKYSQITCAGYGLTLTDVGLGDPQRTMAGSIRDERRSQRSGFAVAREKVRTMIDTEILPPYLKFVWVVKDEEAKIQKARAFFLSAQALAKSKEAGFLNRREGQAQLVEEGHVTVEVEPPEEPVTPPQFQLPPAGDGADARDEADRVPPSEGGVGDIEGRQQQRAELGEERIAAAPKDSPKFDQLAQVMRDGFADMLRNADQPRIKKLVKAATRALFPDTIQAMVELSDTELPLWTEQRALFWFNEPSEFDDLPDVRKAGGEVLFELDALLKGDEWWLLTPGVASGIDLILRLAYEEGATEAANVVQELLYTEGLVASPDIIGLNFSLTNPTTLAQLEKSAAQLVTRVNEGTKFFLKRIITAGVEEGLSSPAIAQMIRDGVGVEEILREAGYTEGVVRQAQFEIGRMAEMRTNSIVNTEIARAETEGRVGQWDQMGLTRKAWMHTGPGGVNDPCPVCVANIEMGFVPIDFMYESVFGASSILGPPAHPQVDHCHIIFDENELVSRSGELEAWSGN